MRTKLAPPASRVGALHSSFSEPGFTSDLQREFREVDLRLIPRTGQVHLALREAEESLRLALQEWAAVRSSAAGTELVGRLAALRIHLDEHRANIEAEGSLSDRVKSGNPWLISQLQHLLRHHDELGSAIFFASAEYERTTDDTRAAVRVHRRAKGITAALTTLLAVEGSLLMDQFCEPPALD